MFTEAGYQALVEDIFRRFPSVQKEGFTAGAYKPGLERMLAFEEALGHPTRRFRSIHIAGTNGKGSVANMLASALGACGLKTGLFTSPHLLDFRERMRVTSKGNTPEVAKKRADASSGVSPFEGQASCYNNNCHSERSEESYLISKEYVYEFLTRWMPWITEHQLSFFEITTGLAFKWFADSQVDVAVIETGLGGRLDSTNILEEPLLTVITTIGFDHMAMLGDTLPKIAAEKAGIFKAGVPALVGEWQADTAPVFEVAAAGIGASGLTFADQVQPSLWPRHADVLAAMDLQADIQVRNLRTVLAAVDILRPVLPALPDDEVLLDGIVHTARNMGFHGRWERLCQEPCVIADIGHNAHALQHNFAQLEERVASGACSNLIIIYGIMADKDLDAILPLMPRCATYFFVAPDMPRALPAEDILRRFKAYRAGTSEAVAMPSVADAVRRALSLATPDTLIYIGGSTFVVAEALPLFAC